jgi:hypothetical protein
VRKGKDKDRKKLAISGAVLALSVIFAIFVPDLLIRIFTFKIVFFKVYHVFWLLIMFHLARRMMPRFSRKVTSGKIFEKYYNKSSIVNPSIEQKLKAYRAKINSGAMQTALYWTLVVIVVGILYYFKAFRTIDIYLVVIFFIFMDKICASVWCPFQWLIKNKCCNSCRINSWSYLMAFAPLIYLPSFWTYSVLALSAALVIQWEYMFHKHPERFYELYNENLMCKNCTTKCRQIQD